MKKLLSLSVLLGAVTLSAQPKVQPPAIDLFNGVDLRNWKGVFATNDTKMEDVFSVQGGIITCKGEPLGYIYTDRSFVNFRLEVEWRWVPGQPPGNSGVFLRINGEPSPLPRCIECQLKSGDAGDIYAFHSMRMDGDRERRVVKKGHELGGDLVGFKKYFANENTPGTWNRLEVELKGYDLTVKVNGRLVNKATRCEFVKGPIGLQSEGGQVQFRKVRLYPLN